MKYDALPDGEYFVDVQSQPIVTKATWADLSLNQLLEVQTQLQSRIWDFRQNQALVVQLQRSLQELEKLIAKKLNE